METVLPLMESIFPALIVVNESEYMRVSSATMFLVETNGCFSSSSQFFVVILLSIDIKACFLIVH